MPCLSGRKILTLDFSFHLPVSCKLPENPGERLSSGEAPSQAAGGAPERLTALEARCVGGAAPAQLLGGTCPKRNYLHSYAAVNGATSKFQAQHRGTPHLLPRPR